MRPGCHFRILATPDFGTFSHLRLPPLPPHLQRPLHMLRRCCTRSLRCPTRIFSLSGAFWAELWPVFYFAPHTHHPICALFGLPPVAAKLCTRVAMARICRIGPLRCCTRGLSWFGALWVELWQKVHFSIQPAATPLWHPLPLLPSPASPKRCAAASQSLAHARHARCGAARRVWAALAHSEGPRAPLFTFHFSHTHAQHAHTLCSEVPPRRPWWGALTRSTRCTHSLRCRTRVFSWFGAFSGALRPSFHLSPRTRSGPLLHSAPFFSKHMSAIPLLQLATGRRVCGGAGPTLCAR